MPTLPVVAFVLGGWDLGVAGLLLQGVIFAQFARCTTLYTHDILILRVFVWGLLLLTTLKSAQGLAVRWSQNIRHFLEFEAAIPKLMFSRNQHLLRCSHCVLRPNVLLTPSVGDIIEEYLRGGIENDTFRDRAAGCLYIPTLQRPSSANNGTTGCSPKANDPAPAARCTLFGLIASQIPTSTGNLSFWTTLAIMTNSWLPKLYAFSALWTLNSRKGIAQSGALMTSSEWHRYTENHLDVGRGITSTLARSIELHTPRLHAIPV
ncbi:hypothetical protein B0H19DRAFT_1261166 [Mycena capillaripes]|nr:hypothetical protein B0H19DRAFT_1261166 [Mycena capillaripes]